MPGHPYADPIVCIPHMGRLHHKCNRLQLLATCSITITNKQNHNAIDYDYIESHHDYNRDYICLETSSERKENSFARFDVSTFSRYESMQQTKLLICKDQAPEKSKNTLIVY